MEDPESSGYKDPAGKSQEGRNIHQQVRFVDKITIRFDLSFWSLFGAVGSRYVLGYQYHLPDNVLL